MPLTIAESARDPSSDPGYTVPSGKDQGLNLCPSVTGSRREPRRPPVTVRRATIFSHRAGFERLSVIDHRRAVRLMGFVTDKMAKDGIGPVRMSFSHGPTTPEITESKRHAVPTTCPRAAPRAYQNRLYARCSIRICGLLPGMLGGAQLIIIAASSSPGLGQRGFPC